VVTTKQTILVIKLCSKSYFKIIKERKELIKISAELNAIEPFVDKFQIDRDNIFDLIRNNRNSNNYDEHLNTKLWSEYLRYEEKRKEFVGEKELLLKKSGLEVNRLGRLVLDENLNNISEINNLNVLLRSDLNDSEDIDEYRRAISSNSDEAHSFVKGILDDYQKEYI